MQIKEVSSLPSSATIEQSRPQKTDNHISTAKWIMFLRKKNVNNKIVVTGQGHVSCKILLLNTSQCE